MFSYKHVENPLLNLWHFESLKMDNLLESYALPNFCNEYIIFRGNLPTLILIAQFSQQKLTSSFRFQT